MAKLRSNQFLLPSGALITELPILFQTEMVQAILADRKSQTRRDRNLDHVNDREYLKTITRIEMGYSDTGEYGLLIYRNGDQYNHTFIKSPFGKPGDLLYAKETWATIGANSVCFKAGMRTGLFTDRMRSAYKSSLHLRKADSRIWLMNEDIRVERLQDISEADAIAEGIMEFESQNSGWSGPMYGLPTSKIYGVNVYIAFYNLWVSINGQGSWNANPYIWVIRYRVLSKTGRPSMEVIEQAYSEIVNPKSEIRKEAVHD